MGFPRVVPERLLQLLPRHPHEQTHLLADLAGEPAADGRHVVDLLGARGVEVAGKIVFILLPLGRVVDVHLPHAAGQQDLGERGKGRVRSVPLLWHPPPSIIPSPFGCWVRSSAEPIWVPTGGRSPARRAAVTTRLCGDAGGTEMRSPVIYSSEPRLETKPSRHGRGVQTATVTWRLIWAPSRVPGSANTRRVRCPLRHRVAVAPRPSWHGAAGGAFRMPHATG